ncbi:hypothetical protein [Bacillus changyiensis]|uniref:hypothetical protein n=1 Tax=Bacillus changyiensis TaxID=3004103 RepID=UPI0022E32CFE|nr:hypothetical protein [Bacillus changyiensis]MDA1476656.1 hypothetical protein [Bacillus changyiensis]
MKKIVTTLLTAVLLVSAFFIGSSEASAMTSKGRIHFETDANTYTKRATSIVVRGTLEHRTSSIFTDATVYLRTQYGHIVRRININAGKSYKFKVSFSTKNLSPGKYDVEVWQRSGVQVIHGELNHYITVQH